MKRLMTKRELMTAYGRIGRRISALYKAQNILRDNMAKRCPLKVNDIVEVVEQSGRKHWGEVSRVEGHVWRDSARWEVSLRNTRKHGGWIGGWFRLREDTTREWRVIPRAKS